MNPTAAATAVSTGAMVLRVVLALALVLGIFTAVLYLYRRATRAGAAPRRQQRIEILAQRSLGTRTSLALVQVAGETLLIGVTPQQITALGPVSLETDEEAMRALVMAPEHDGAPGAPDAPASETAPALARLARSAPAAPPAAPTRPATPPPAPTRPATPPPALPPADARFAQTLQIELTRVRRAIESPAREQAEVRAQRAGDARAVEV